MRSSYGSPKNGFSNAEVQPLISWFAGKMVPGEHPGVNPAQIETFDALSYLQSQVMSKYDDGKPSPEKAVTTWKRFHEAEDICKRTNDRFSELPTMTRSEGFSVGEILFTAKHLIDKVIGPLCLNEVSERFAWGPGATTRLPRRKRFGAFKHSGIPEVTASCIPLAAAAIALSPSWALSVSGFTDVHSVARALMTKVVPGNKIVTVPKSYKTDRTIAIEPCMNIYIQKGFGSVIRSRLRKVGIDLNDQTKNQKLAHEGSASGMLATIDLSMASDCLSTGLVEYLLPTEWFSALEQCRSPVGRLPSGEGEISYQKFSSMGNGYTFELESLIFWALASATVASFEEKDRRVSVYGDDIIVPSYAATRLIQVLDYCGFVPNPDKSFWSGAFRESCGKHYFSGEDVSPFYIRKPIETADDLFLLHNNLFKWLQAREGSLAAVAYETCVSLRGLQAGLWTVPQLPLCDSQGAFQGYYHEIPKVFNAFGELVCRTWKSRPRTRKVTLYGALLYALSMHPDRPLMADEITEHSSLPSEHRTHYVSTTCVGNSVQGWI